MTEIKYFPVVLITSNGMYRAAVFPTNYEKTVEENHKTYLEEIAPGGFRLYSKEFISKDVSISCPYCGKYLDCLIEGDGIKRRSVYRCTGCSKTLGSKNLYAVHFRKTARGNA